MVGAPPLAVDSVLYYSSKVVLVGVSRYGFLLFEMCLCWYRRRPSARPAADRHLVSCFIEQRAARGLIGAHCSRSSDLGP